jgi:hypothetical protein
MIQVNENFYAARQEIMNHHPNFNRTKDSRITVFINCIVTFVLLREALNCEITEGVEPNSTNISTIQTNSIISADEFFYDYQA